MVRGLMLQTASNVIASGSGDGWFCFQAASTADTSWGASWQSVFCMPYFSGVARNATSKLLS